MDDFADVQLLGNHADDVPAVRQRRIRHDAHQTHAATAIDEFNFFAREQRAQRLRRRRVFRANALVGTTIDSYAFHFFLFAR